MITGGCSTPSAIALTGGNRHRVTQLLPLVDAVPRIRGKRGRPHGRPGGGRAYDKCRRLLWRHGSRPAIALSGVPYGSGLGAVRWVAERTNAWNHGFRRLRVPRDIRDDIHEAFPKPACCVITCRRVLRVTSSSPAP